MKIQTFTHHLKLQETLVIPMKWGDSSYGAKKLGCCGSYYNSYDSRALILHYVKQSAFYAIVRRLRIHLRSHDRRGMIMYYQICLVNSAFQVANYDFIHFVVRIRNFNSSSAIHSVLSHYQFDLFNKLMVKYPYSQYFYDRRDADLRELPSDFYRNFGLVFSNTYHLDGTLRDPHVKPNIIYHGAYLEHYKCTINKLRR